MCNTGLISQWFHIGAAMYKPRMHVLHKLVKFTHKLLLINYYSYFKVNIRTTCNKNNNKQSLALEISL